MGAVGVGGCIVVVMGGEGEWVEAVEADILVTLTVVVIVGLVGCEGTSSGGRRTGSISGRRSSK